MAEVADSPRVKEDRLDLPSSGNAMRPERGSRGGGTSSSSDWGTENGMGLKGMCLMLGD